MYRPHEAVSLLEHRAVFHSSFGLEKTACSRSPICMPLTLGNNSAASPNRT